MKNNSIISNISKILDGYKKTRFTQNFDTALLEYGQAKTKRKRKIAVNPKDIKHRVRRVKENTDQDSLKRMTRAFHNKKNLLNVSRNALRFKQSSEADSFSPSVGKYSPSYDYVYPSPMGNTKFKPMSPQNSERIPFNTFFKAYHVENKYNDFVSAPCEKFKKESKPKNKKHKFAASNRAHLTNMISKIKKFRKPKETGFLGKALSREYANKGRCKLLISYA